MTELLFALVLAMAPPQGLGADTCADVVPVKGPAVSFAQVLGEPATLLQLTECSTDPRIRVFLARPPRASEDAPLRLFGVLHDLSVRFRLSLRLQPDELAPFVVCTGSRALLVRPSLGRVQGYHLSGDVAFTVTLPGYAYQDEPAVFVAGEPGRWFALWSAGGTTHWAEYTDNGQLQAHDSLPGLPAQLVVWQHRPWSVQYFVQNARVQRFELVDLQNRQRAVSSPQRLAVWPVDSTWMLLQEGIQWFRLTPDGQRFPLALEGKLRVFLRPGGGLVVLLQGTWSYEGPQRRPVYHLQRVFWLTADGVLHSRPLSTPLHPRVPVEFHGQGFVIKSCSRYWRLP